MSGPATHPDASRPTPPGTDADDLRPLLADVEDDVRRRRLRLTAPGVAVILLVGAGLVAGADGDRWMALTGAGLVLLGVTAGVQAVVRHHVRGVVVRVGTADGTPATVLHRRAAAFWAGLGALGVIALVPLVAAVTLVFEGSHGIGVALGVVAVACGWPLVPAALGRYVPGSVELTRTGVRYRHLGLESVMAWDDIGGITVLEGGRLMVVHPVPDATARHRYRARPRGQRIHLDDSIEATLQDWGVLVTDLGRMLLHYAENPADRVELGTEAAAERWDRLTAMPVLHRADQWVVGGAREPGDSPQASGAWDAGLPLWRDTAVDHALGGVQPSRNGRLWLALGALLVLPGAFAIGEPAPWGPVAVGAFALAALTTVALGMVSPRPPGLAPAGGPGGSPGGSPTVDGGVVLRCSRTPLRMKALALGCLAVGTAASTALAATTIVGHLVGAVLVLALLVVPVSVVTGRLAARELRVDEHGVTFRSAWASSTVPWPRPLRADLLRDGLIRLGLPDGAALRIDVADMGVPPGDVATLLDRYARQGGPRGETRDVAAVHRALHQDATNGAPPA